MEISNVLDSISLDVNNIFDRVGKGAINERLSEYYDKLYEKTSNIKFKNLGYNVLHCGDNSNRDTYHELKLIDLKYINNCHNRFCPCCQKLIQSTRLSNFKPHLDKAIEEGQKLYHIIFTVPNVSGKYLGNTIDCMFNAFSTMIRYFRKIKKLKDYDFSFLRFQSALRSLEVTYSIENGSYHPHLHCIFAFNNSDAADISLFNDYVNVKRHVNDYSLSYGVFKHKFSDFEIFLQKFWRLLYDFQVEKVAKDRHAYAVYKKVKAMHDGNQMKAKENAAAAQENYEEDPFPDFHSTVVAERVTMVKINKLKIGYSCIVMPINTDDSNESRGSLFEVFKYAIKFCDEDSKLIEFDQFEKLYHALKSRRAMQGYGSWFNLQCDDKIDESFVSAYDVIINYATDVCEDISKDVRSSCQELVDYAVSNDYKIISRKKIDNIFNKLDLTGVFDPKYYVPLNKTEKLVGDELQAFKDKSVKKLVDHLKVNSVRLKKRKADFIVFSARERIINDILARELRDEKNKPKSKQIEIDLSAIF